MPPTSRPRSEAYHTRHMWLTVTSLPSGSPCSARREWRPPRWPMLRWGRCACGVGSPKTAGGGTTAVSTTSTAKGKGERIGADDALLAG